MNCIICNQQCKEIGYSWNIDLAEFTCIQNDHQLWVKGQIWYIIDNIHKLLINSCGICLHNELQNYIIRFPDYIKLEEAPTYLQQIIKLKAFL